jgi:hypothetical protein
MALDKSRILTNAKQNVADNQAALPANPTQDDYLDAIFGGIIDAITDEITSNIEITVTGVTVNPSTGEQIQDAQGTAL